MRWVLLSLMVGLTMAMVSGGSAQACGGAGGTSYVQPPSACVPGGIRVNVYVYVQPKADNGTNGSNGVNGKNKSSGDNGTNGSNNNRKTGNNLAPKGSNNAKKASNLANK